MASTGNPRMLQHTGDAPGVGLPRHTGAESGAAVKAKLVRNVKETAAAAPYQSAYTIVEHLLQESRPIPNQRSTDYLGRIANYHRQQSRPCHPQDLGFELDMRHWPDQFEDPVDITVGNKRHVLFFSKQQLTLLSQAKRWYADGTFKVVRAPFTQLWREYSRFCLCGGPDKAAATRLCDYVWETSAGLSGCAVGLETGTLTQGSFLELGMRHHGL
ncbi:hypothetical protein ACOMHN_006035 [Nucella lapillus]